MSRYAYDLHVHSCLSPCADNDNTPNNLAGMATLCGIGVMALTDHNSCKNCPAFFEAARRCGIVPVPGMELTTAEDIHLVCLFETLEGAMEFDREIGDRRIRIKNRVDIFGEQLILDGEDRVIGQEEDLLLNATTVTLDEAPEFVRSCGGVCYPAHIDREANGILAVLGAIPEQPDFAVLELHDPEKAADYAARGIIGGRRIVSGSDAHYLTDLREQNPALELDDTPYSSARVRRELLEYLRGRV